MPCLWFEEIIEKLVPEFLQLVSWEKTDFLVFCIPVTSNSTNRKVLITSSRAANISISTFGTTPNFLTFTNFDRIYGEISCFQGTKEVLSEIDEN